LLILIDQQNNYFTLKQHRMVMEKKGSKEGRKEEGRKEEEVFN
jgi:hypothetical protein